MVQKKLPSINSAHGSETRNIINELIKLFNNMGYTYDEALQKAHDVLSQAQRTNSLNNNTNARLDKIIADSGTSSTEVVDARGTHTVLNSRLVDIEDDVSGKADGSVYRDMQKAKPNSFNVIQGYSGNQIADDVFASNISGGGTAGQENIIGGETNNIGTANSNKKKLGTTTYLSRILGGYDQVVNGITNFSNADHSYIEEPANHTGIFSGAYHKILSGGFSLIAGGIRNVMDGSRSYIGGGSDNSITSDDSVIGGGSSNKVTGNVSTVGGGSGNEANNFYATVGGGQRNKAQGIASAVAGGQDNEAVGSFCNIMGGQRNVATGFYSTIYGGQDNEAAGLNSIASGAASKARFKNESAYGAGMFNVKGDAQRSEIVDKIQTTDATQKSLLALTPGQNCTWGVRGTMTARKIGSDSKSAMWKFEGLIDKPATGQGASIGTIQVTEIAKTSTASYQFECIYQYGALSLKVTGAAGENVNWLGYLEISQLLG